jgi:predicted nucleotidyltransferase
MNRDTTLTQRRAEYVESLERTLDKIVARLADTSEVRQGGMLGSYAASRRDLFTDLDLLVV